MVLRSWWLQIARIHINLRFNFKSVYESLLCIIYCAYLTMFTYTFIFKGLIFSLLVLTGKTFFPAIPALILLLVLCCFCNTASFTWLHTHVWHYLILQTVSLKVPPSCFCPEELPKLNLLSLGHLPPVLVLSLLSSRNSDVATSPRLSRCCWSSHPFLSCLPLWLQWLSLFLMSSIPRTPYILSCRLLWPQPHLKHQRLTKTVR